MAGMTKEGFSTKRQIDVIEDLKDAAIPIFQDLVPPGDIVDTSDSSTIGRIIGLLSLPLADLWEAAQQVYLAFDPNSSSGIALDNLVAYGGIKRAPAQPTTATVVLWGDVNTTILANSSVRSTDNNTYNLITTTLLDPSRCIGAKLKLSSVVSGTTYSTTISTGSLGVTASVVASGSDTITSVLLGLFNQLSGNSAITMRTTEDSLYIELSDIYNTMSITSVNILIDKVKDKSTVVSEQAGAHDQSAHTINRIATPILGWDSVDNPFNAISGKDKETDDQLRVRFRDSKFIRAQNIGDALYSALLDVYGVEYVAIYENETDVYDAVYDLQPHSFKPVVFGGDTLEIAKRIWQNKPLGISSEGNTSEIVVDSQGFQQTVAFERPSYKDVYITINITTDSNFPINGNDMIKSAIASYFKDSLNIGDDVVYSRLYTPINTVPGHQIDSMYIGTSASPIGVLNIPVDYNEIAAINTDNIVINS